MARSLKAIRNGSPSFTHSIFAFTIAYIHLFTVLCFGHPGGNGYGYGYGGNFDERAFGRDVQTISSNSSTGQVYPNPNTYQQFGEQQPMFQHQQTYGAVPQSNQEQPNPYHPTYTHHHQHGRQQYDNTWQQSGFPASAPGNQTGPAAPSRHHHPSRHIVGGIAHTGDRTAMPPQNGAANYPQPPTAGQEQASTTNGGIPARPRHNHHQRGFSNQHSEPTANGDQLLPKRADQHNGLAVHAQRNAKPLCEMSVEEIATEIETVNGACLLFISLQHHANNNKDRKRAMLASPNCDQLNTAGSYNMDACWLFRDALNHAEGETSYDELIDAGETLLAVLESTLEKYSHFVSHRPDAQQQRPDLIHALESLRHGTRQELLNAIDAFEAKKKKRPGQLHFHTLRNEWADEREARDELKLYVAAGQAFARMVMDKNNNVARKREIVHGEFDHLPVQEEAVALVKKLFKRAAVFEAGADHIGEAIFVGTSLLARMRQVEEKYRRAATTPGNHLGFSSGRHPLQSSLNALSGTAIPKVERKVRELGELLVKYQQEEAAKRHEPCPNLALTTRGGNTPVFYGALPSFPFHFGMPFLPPLGMPSMPMFPSFHQNFRPDQHRHHHSSPSSFTTRAAIEPPVSSPPTNSTITTAVVPMSTANHAQGQLTLSRHPVMPLRALAVVDKQNGAVSGGNLTDSSDGVEAVIISPMVLAELLRLRETSPPHLSPTEILAKIYKIHRMAVAFVMNVRVEPSNGRHQREFHVSWDKMHDVHHEASVVDELSALFVEAHRAAPSASEIEGAIRVGEELARWMEREINERYEGYPPPEAGRGGRKHGAGRSRGWEQSDSLVRDIVQAQEDLKRVYRELMDKLAELDQFKREKEEDLQRGLHHQATIEQGGSQNQRLLLPAPPETMDSVISQGGSLGELVRESIKSQGGSAGKESHHHQAHHTRHTRQQLPLFTREERRKTANKSAPAK